MLLFKNTQIEIGNTRGKIAETQDKLKKLVEIKAEIRLANQNIADYINKKQEAEQRFSNLEELYLQVV